MTQPSFFDALGLAPRPAGDATFSPCGLYRYRLSRSLEGGVGVCLFVMLNPSTATADVPDPTITRCTDFARRWGYARLDVANLFAWRLTDSKKLKLVAEPVGPDNDRHIQELAVGAHRIVVAWGNNGTLHGRGSHVLKLLRSASSCVPLCFRVTKTNQPEHPLYQRGDSVLIEGPNV